MKALSRLLREVPPPPEPVSSRFSHLPMRKIATTGVTAAATLVAVSAASAATSALRRRAGHR